MKFSKRKRICTIAVIAIAALLWSRSVEDIQAQGFDLDIAVDKIKTANQAIAKSERRIQKVSDQRRDLLQEHRAVERRSQALGVYNAQLESLIQSQQRELSSLQDQIDKVIVVSRQIIPLMLRMIDSLAKFIELDIPFLMEERRARVAGLRKMMNRADVTDSEKYHRILEAYQIENEYGRTIETYRGELDLNSHESTVDFLRVGRVVLLYQNLDGRQAGMWDRSSGSWKKLPRRYLSSLSKALRIARKQAAPDLILLPFPALRKSD